MLESVARRVVIQLPATAVTRTGTTSPASVASRASIVSAGGPGHWTQVTAAVGAGSIKDVGLVRDGNGVLHVIWEGGSVAGSEKIIDTPIAPDGTVLKSATIASAQNGRLDVLALLTTKNHEIAYFATQVLLPKA